MLKLYVGNRNYSSWSMRAGVLLAQAGIPHDAVVVRFDSLAPESDFKRTILPLNPTGRVPVLVDGDLVVWDTLAIAEYVAERFPDRHLWPEDRASRARARSVCAEMHSGFSALRNSCPMNIEASLPEIGQIAWRDQPALRDDVQRIVGMWSGLLEQHGGPLLFGRFSIADAYFAPVCMRLRTYALPVPAAITAYVERVTALPGVRSWIDAALAEHAFVVFDEPYRTQRSPG